MKKLINRLLIFLGSNIFIYIIFSDFTLKNPNDAFDNGIVCGISMVIVNVIIYLMTD